MPVPPFVMVRSDDESCEMTVTTARWLVNQEISVSSWRMTPERGVAVEAAIGQQIARLRTSRGLSLTQLGEAMGRYLGRAWSRQAVHQAERGRRAFTAAELAALAMALDTSIPALFITEADQIELPGTPVSAEDYRALLIYAGQDTPVDGIEELLVAVHDIAQVLSRPALARLVKIGGVADEVAGESVLE
jgi:transcriptional regulator with XRE-family HTH domain